MNDELGWVSVEERVPKEMGKYEVVFLTPLDLPLLEQNVIYSPAIKRWFEANDEMLNSLKVTHWFDEELFKD